VTFPQLVPVTDRMLQKVRASVAAAVKAAGKRSLADFGKLSLCGAQVWAGGNVLTPTTQVRPRIMTVGGVRIPVPVAPAPTVSVDDFLVLADEIVFDSTLAAVITVAGVVAFAANKITVKPGARITWNPHGFNAATFDQPGYGANGGAGAPGHGSTWSCNPHPASKQGGKGGDGSPGAVGFDGPDAPSVVLVGVAIDRLPSIDLTGHRGGNGGTGGNGGPGGPGDKGEPASCTLGVRNKGRGYGGDGGAGGNAGRGGHGGKGGSGGNVMVYCPPAVLPSFTNVPLDVRLQPGPGGAGGPAGAPGPGGPGGPQGDNCGIGDDTNGRHGFPGPYGQPDTTPPAQLHGPDGDLHGTLELLPVPENEIRQLLLDPGIVSMSPTSAPPGATITLNCVNLPAVAPQVKLSLPPTSRIIAPATRVGDVLTVRIPDDIRCGDYDVALVGANGAPLSIISVASLCILPLLTLVAGVGRWGTTLTLTGKGFGPDVRVFVGALSYLPSIISTTSLRLALPMPADPFEQLAETRPLRVVDGKGRSSNTLPLPFEHWLHLGFQPVNSMFAFENSAASLQAANVTIDEELFKDTFGQDDFAVLKPEDALSVIGDALNPLKAAGAWTFFAVYKAFLKAKPGICCAMSAYALDCFLSKAQQPLHDAYPALQGTIARDLFALQGRVLSKQVIELGLSAMGQGDASNGEFMNSLIARLRGIVSGTDPTSRREYPLLSFLPKVQNNITELAKALPEAHVIIPYAVRFPGAGEQFLCRVYCCNNFQRNVIRVEFTQQGGSVAFTTAMVAATVNLAGWADAVYETNAPYGPWPGGANYSTAASWLCAPLPMRTARYDDVDMPLELMVAIIAAFASAALFVGL